LEIYDALDESGDKLSMIYHSKEVGHSNLLLGQGRSCLEIPEGGFTEKDRSERQAEFEDFLAFTFCRIRLLSH
jgi:hypothetical protein